MFRATEVARELLFGTITNPITARAMLMWQVRFYIAGLSTCVAGGPQIGFPFLALLAAYSTKIYSVIKLCCRRFSP